MNRSKYFAFVMMSMIVILLSTVTRTLPVGASNSETATPSTEEEGIKNIIQEYFEIRYRAFNTLQLDGFGNLISNQPEANAFLGAELGKLAVEIKHAELNHLRYMNYVFFLDYKNITVDNSTQTATVSLSIRHDVVYEVSVELDPVNPIVSHMYNVEHIVLLHQVQGQWKIVSDNYADYLWRMLRQTGISTDEMLRNMKVSPEPMLQSASIQTEFNCNLPADDSTHSYDRQGAVDYALAHIELEAYNPNYPNYGADPRFGDCTNFVSQSIYEGGKASMAFCDQSGPYCSVGPDGNLGWFFSNENFRASAWTEVGKLHEFITSPFVWSEGPEGCEVSIEQIALGDVIQYEWGDNDGEWDHAVIVVDVIGGIPFIASHSQNVGPEPYTFFAYQNVRFIHIERSDGYGPVPTSTPVATITSTPAAVTPTATPTPTPGAGDWIKLGSWDVGCNTVIDFPPVNASQFGFWMTSGGGWDNHISFYGYGSSGAAWFANGVWQEIQNQTAALDVGEWRETSYFSPTFVTQQRFNVGCNDGETMGVDAYYRFSYDPVSIVPPPPIICSGICYWKQCSSTSQSASAKNASLAQGYVFAIDNADRIAGQATLLYRIRDEILSTSAIGQRYINLYYANSAEIASIMTAHSELAEQGLDVIDALTPNLQALLDGQGNTVIITYEQIQQSEAFLDALLPYASTELQQAVADEQLRFPLNQLIGQTMSQAWVEINATSTATPTSTPTFTPTFTSTNTPTQTLTFTPTNTPTAAPTATNTPTKTPTKTPTRTPTSTATRTPTRTPTNTPTSSSNFPSTSILDSFNRANGSIGSSWSGYTSKYHITSSQMTVDYNGSNSDIYWNNSFGANQEAYVTFTDIDTSASEQDLLLKSQSNTTWGDGVLEVLYDPTGQTVQVWTYEWPAGWVQYGADIPVTFVDGDTFGARALANGTVEVYRNETLLATRDITSWSHYAGGGYIGLWFIGAEDAILDDFGGGTISSGAASMSMLDGSMESETLTPAQLSVNVQDAVIYWQGIPIGSKQPANVTFTNIPANKQSLLLKPQSNGMWGDGVVEVLYDLAGQRIQVWVYDAQAGNGWVQYGKDIPVKFVAGDTFSVQVLADGTVEIQRNGKLLAQRDVMP